MIFKKIKYQQADQSSWSNTKSVLINQISRVLPETSKEEISKNIERAHRVHSKGTSSNRSPPHLVVKMVNWEFSEKVKSAFIQEDHRSSFLRCIWSHSLTYSSLPKPSPETPAWNEKRRPFHTRLLRYPAILMIKRSGEKKNSERRFKKNFNFILCWHSVLVSFLAAHVYVGCRYITDMQPFRSVGIKKVNHYNDLLFFWEIRSHWQITFIASNGFCPFSRNPPSPCS